MKVEFFFAKKIIKRDKNSFSGPIIKISIIAIALGIALMTISLSIVNGFKEEIKSKISGFGAHLIISNYNNSSSIENKAILNTRECFNKLDSIEGVSYSQSFIYRPAIIKTDNTNYGIVIKGVDKEFNWNFFKDNIVKGQILKLNTEDAKNEVVVSKKIADKLNLDLDDEIVIYFVQNPARFRKLKIKGIYDTGLGELDEKIVLTDLRHLQKINNWSKNQVNGIEVYLDDFSKIDQLEKEIYDNIDYDLGVTSIKKSRADLFNWLELQDINVVIIIGLLLLVSGINIIATLLILIIEKTNTIGILKALGAKNFSISKIFILNALYLILIGLGIGNIIGLGFSYIQLEFGLVKLPQEAYFIDKVPILINPMELITLNIGTVLFCLLVLIVPSRIVSKIEPIKSIRFD